MTLAEFAAQLAEHVAHDRNWTLEQLPSPFSTMLQRPCSPLPTMLASLLLAPQP